MNITNDQAYESAIETGLLDKALGWEIADNTKLAAFAQRFYDLGVDNAHEDKLADYVQRIEFQRNATERLQAQIEAEHTKVVKARLVMEQLIKRIPGNLLDPYTEGQDHNTVALQQAVAMAKSFLEDTQ